MINSYLLAQMCFEKYLGHFSKIFHFSARRDSQKSDIRRLGCMTSGGYNKHGQIFSGILVLITVAMCLLSIAVYMKQQGDVQSSLVSPLIVLQVRDDLVVFEMREEELILDSLKTSDFNAESFKSEFVSGISEDADMREFIFSDMYYQDVKGDDMSESTRDSFIENVLYSVSEDSGNLILKRAKISKAFELRALNVSETNFAVDFDFEFEREYLISKDGNEFNIEVVE